MKAAGADRLQFAYPAARQTRVTDYSSGAAASRTYTFEEQGGVLRPTGADAPCPLCGDTNRTTMYDGAGNVSKSIGHDGRPTFYKYNAKGQETEKATFAAGYANSATRPALRFAESVVSTKWHGTWNLPIQIAEPGSLQTFTYSPRGMTGYSWTATTDATGGSKFSAVATGSTYATGWSYNANNLLGSVVQMIDGAETQRWTLVYDAIGDLTRITEPSTGKIARGTSYDAHGALIRGTDIDGAAVRFTYNTRGYLIQSEYDTVTTTFTRNAIGLPTAATSPSTALAVTYDSAHRITGVTTDIQFPPASPGAFRSPFSSLPGWLSKGALALFPSAHAQATISLPAPAGGVLSPRTDRQNRGAWDDLSFRRRTRA